MKYFMVTAKCGHVRRNNYTLMNLFIKADSKKDAASIARGVGRVKHHHRDAIRDVVEISFDEYIEGLKANDQNSYFQVHNSSDARAFLSELDIYNEKEIERYRKPQHKWKILEKSIRKSNRCLGEYIYG